MSVNATSKKLNLGYETCGSSTVYSYLSGYPITNGVTNYVVEAEVHNENDNAGEGVAYGRGVKRPEISFKNSKHRSCLLGLLFRELDEDVLKRSGKGVEHKDGVTGLGAGVEQQTANVGVVL